MVFNNKLLFRSNIRFNFFKQNDKDWNKIAESMPFKNAEKCCSKLIFMKKTNL